MMWSVPRQQAAAVLADIVRAHGALAHRDPHTTVALLNDTAGASASGLRHEFHLLGQAVPAIPHLLAWRDPNAPTVIAAAGPDPAGAHWAAQAWATALGIVPVLTQGSGSTGGWAPGDSVTADDTAGRSSSRLKAAIIVGAVALALVIGVVGVALAGMGGGGPEAASNPPITGFTAVRVNGTVEFSWDAYPGASSYNVSSNVTSAGSSFFSPGNTGTRATDDDPSVDEVVYSVTAYAGPGTPIPGSRATTSVPADTTGHN